MREIKFRAWYKGDAYHTPTMRCDIQDAYDVDDGTEGCFGRFLQDDRYTVMQYIGIKDKHGTEIYEGDIVEFDFDSTHTNMDPYKCIATVFYDANQAAFRFVRPTGGFVVARDPAMMTVLGNVYEDPGVWLLAQQNGDS